MKDIVFLVDGNEYLHRAFSVKGAHDPGAATVNTFISLVFKDALTVRASKLGIAFDGNNVFRYSLNKNYKQRDQGKGEKSTDVMYQTSLPQLLELLTRLGISWTQNDKYEGDDLLHATTRDDKNIYVIGGRDKDLYQSVKGNVRTFNSHNGPEYVDEEAVARKFGVAPALMTMYQAIHGDKIDTVQGLKGYGPKNTAKICNEHQSFQAWFKAADKETKSLLRRNQRRLSMNLRMVTLSEKAVMQYHKVNKQVLEIYPGRVPNSLVDYVGFLYPRTKGLF